MGARPTLRSQYGRILGAYRAWAGPLLPPALLVFVPTGLVEALTHHVEIGERQLGDGFLLAGTVLAVLALIGTSVFGQIFYSGIVAGYLTHDEERGPPSLREVAAETPWRPLIAVDLVFAAMVLAGFALLVIPGVVLYVWFTLAGPLVELEGRGALRSLARSRRLVRGRFWFVLAVVAPIEIGSEAIGEGVTAAVATLLGDGLPAEWVASTGVNVLLSPLLAIAFVLLTVGLIAEKEGRAPRLHSAPMSR